MRELSDVELSQLSGGFGDGTKIPFANLFWKGPNFPGGPAAVIPALVVSYDLGYRFGEAINSFNSNVSGMSLGVAVFRTFGGGSNLPASGTARIEEV
jgi:hypothetical protein